MWGRLDNVVPTLQIQSSRLGVINAVLVRISPAETSKFAESIFRLKVTIVFDQLSFGSETGTRLTLRSGAALYSEKQSRKRHQTESITW
jgi:hypothetical protein